MTVDESLDKLIAQGLEWKRRAELAEARLATVEGALQAEHDKRIEHDAMCGNLRTIEDVQGKLAEALAQLSTTQAALEAAQRDAALMIEAVHLLRGWRRTFEEGRHGNSPINSTRDWLSRFDAATQEGKPL